jgi:dihydroorotase
MAIQEIVLPMVLQAVGDMVSLERIIDALTAAPRRIFGLPATSIAKGASAYTLFSTEGSNIFSKESSPSLAYNNPFSGHGLKGTIHHITTS